jgi:hypothetical protein
MTVNRLILGANLKILKTMEADRVDLIFLTMQSPTQIRPPAGFTLRLQFLAELFYCNIQLMP